MSLMQGILLPCQCCSLKQLVLNTLGLSLAVSGVFRFWIPLESLLILLHVNPLASIAQVLLLFNWTVCVLLESYSVAIEFIFQVPWSHLKLENISKLRLAAIIAMTSMGLACMCSMWQMCVDVRNCVLESGYCWTTVPLVLAIVSAMAHSVVLGLCVPIQAIIVPLNCNKGIPNIGFRQRDVTLLTAHIWLFIHFIYLCVYYSSHHSLVHVLAILYRFCCTAWMIIYCYPDLTYFTYHWLKRQLPDRIRPGLRMILRDNYLSEKVWRNIRRIVYQRMHANDDVDGNNFQVVVTGLCSVWMNIIRYAVHDVIKLIVANIKVLVLSMLMYHTTTSYLAILAFVLMIAINMYLTDVDQNHSTSTDIDSQPVDENFELQPPIQCTDDELIYFIHRPVIQPMDERFELQPPIQCTDNEIIYIKYFIHRPVIT